MKKFISVIVMLVVALSFGCIKATEIPDGFPTPEPPPQATPVPKLEYKPDAELEKQIAEIAAAAKGKVGVAAVVLETGEAAFLNADGHYPMQSVYKLPIAMAVMEQVRLGKLDLDEVVGVTKEDMVREGMRSPLRDKSPNGGEYTIRELIRLSLVESDGTASDVLIRVAGGAGEIQAYLTQIGIRDMKVVNTEKEIGKDWQTQYENWATPTASVELLRYLESDFNKPLRPEHPVPDSIKDQTVRLTRLTPERINAVVLWGFMVDSVPGAKRIKGFLPNGTVVVHKTGTGGTQNGVTGATNDIGIISLSNGKTLAIAVFVSDSPADEKTREAVIAKIAKACWDRWNKN
ncbi:MAG: serine hydrolase [Pyrinomonadaceae bacterium]|nr:serine hydrolase [Pyrinomonadaceae bacterium]